MDIRPAVFYSFFTMKPNKLSFTVLLPLVFAGSMAFSQVEVVPQAPVHPKDVPSAFPYPDGILTPEYELDQKPAPTVTIGDKVIDLGKFRLSQMAKETRTDLHHNMSREEFLCFSAPAVVPAAKRGEDFGSDYQYQNLWFFLGDRGQIREVRAELVPEGQAICPPYAYSEEPAVIGGISVGERADKAFKTINIDPQIQNDVTGWRYWFSQDPNAENSRNTDINIFAVQEENGRIKRIFSLVETYKNK